MTNSFKLSLLTIGMLLVPATSHAMVLSVARRLGVAAIPTAVAFKAFAQKAQCEEAQTEDTQKTDEDDFSYFIPQAQYLRYFSSFSPDEFEKIQQTFDRRKEKYNEKHKKLFDKAFQEEMIQDQKRNKQRIIDNIRYVARTGGNNRYINLCCAKITPAIQAAQRAGKKINLAYSALHDTDFQKCSIENGNLSYVLGDRNLFRHAHFKNVNLSNSVLEIASFYKATLDEVDASNTSFTNSDFIEATIKNTNWKGAILSRCNFSNAHFIGTNNLSDAEKIEKCNFTETDLSKTGLTPEKLKDCTLCKTKMAGFWGVYENNRDCPENRK